MITSNSDAIVSEIISFSPERLPPLYIKAFQIQKGGYGEGDKLCGTKIPILRQIAKKYSKQISLEECEQLLHHEFHEARFVALVILISKFKDDPIEVLDIYLRNLQRYVNNWDLVDCSAPHILGQYVLQTGDTSKIYKLLDSTNLWENRASVVATWPFIKNGQYMLTLHICKRLMNHEHHLVHKACGWMLREISKNYPDVVIEFVKEYYNVIPGVMRSYALEWLRKRSLNS